MKIQLPSIKIAGFSTGTASVSDINATLEQVWLEILSEKKTLELIAKKLHCSADSLKRAIPKSPFQVRAEEAGIGVVETAIIAFVIEVAYDAIKDIANEQIKKEIYWMWRNIVIERAEKKLPIGAIGKQTKVYDDIQ